MIESRLTVEIVGIYTAISRGHVVLFPLPNHIQAVLHHAEWLQRWTWLMVHLLISTIKFCLEFTQVYVGVYLLGWRQAWSIEREILLSFFKIFVI